MKHFLPFIFFFLFGLATQAQNSNKTELTVYPNPATDYISINDHNDAVGYVVIFNLVGKKIKEFDFVKGEALYVADLPKDMYLVQIQNRRHEILRTQKLNKR